MSGTVFTDYVISAGPLIASEYFFKYLPLLEVHLDVLTSVLHRGENQYSLKNVQWVYVSITQSKAFAVDSECPSQLAVAL